MADLRTTAFIVVAIAAIVVPVGFVGLVLIAAIARRRGAVLGPATLSGIAFAGGLALGSMFLVVTGDLAAGLPFLVVAGALAANEWRLGRRASAGWLVAGTALPWTLLWGAYLVLLARGVDFDAAQVVRSFAIGALPLALGLVVAGRFAGDGRPDASVPARSFGVIARALREPSRIGPFRLPELAAVVTFAVAGLASAFLPLGSGEVRFVIGAVVGSALASEAYVRAMAPQSRRAMEAFSWLGEQDLGDLRRVAPGPIPLSPRAARAWLGSHPAASDESAAIRSLRIQALLMAGRVTDAEEAAADRPSPATPAEAFEQAADRNLVAWWRAAPDAHAMLASLEQDAQAIQPHDGEPHLRAEVTVATARVRQRAVEGGQAGGTAALGSPLDVIAPLVDVRDRLGPRADGLLRRVLWRRLFGTFLTVSLAVGFVGALAGALGTPSG